jgi:hypothetical protein
MSNGKDHAPQPTIRSTGGDMIHDDFRVWAADDITAALYPRDILLSECLRLYNEP